MQNKHKVVESTPNAIIIQPQPGLSAEKHITLWGKTWRYLTTELNGNLLYVRE